MKRGPIDLNEELTLPEAAARLGIDFGRLMEVLEHDPFGPLPTGPEGEPRVPAAVLRGFIDHDKDHRRIQLERLTELTRRMRGPQEPWPAWMQEFIDVDGPKSRRGRVAAGELVDIATLAALLGWSVESVAAAEKQGRLFSIEADGIRYFPRFFADAGVDHRAVELVFRLLAPLGSWSAYHFLMSRKVSLRGATPLEALREGRFEDVERAVWGHLEM